jgi:hypothetical protein
MRTARHPMHKLRKKYLELEIITNFIKKDSFEMVVEVTCRKSSPRIRSMHRELVDIEVPEDNNLGPAWSGSAQCTNVRQTARKSIAVATVASNNAAIQGQKVGEVDSNGASQRNDRALEST